ncbi:BnaAnng11840D [Brassica napus]|uniref:BnaAnng11840D protein n=1 Tax=Brassica napus TaxID=3708 RepID=A0A078IPM6_BRANA|nr:BnaAnng11840D [Brassica napus]
MSCLFAKGNDFKGEEGFVKEALATFYRMKEYHCKPDVYAYNTIINALCRVGNFKKARYGMQTGCRKAIRRRMWEANRMFREMLFRGFAPDVVTYNCLIDGCCKTNRIGRALELFEDMKKRGCVPNQVTVTNEIERGIEMMRMMEKMGHGVAGSSTYTPLIHALIETRRVAEARDLVVEMVEAGLVPREYTYKLVLDALSSEGMVGTLDEEVHKRMRQGIDQRCRRVMEFKPVMARKEVVHDK